VVQYGLPASHGLEARRNGHTHTKENHMAYKVTDACVNCGACDAECPVEAISERNGMRWIDPDKCTDCGSCASVCPTEAIVQG